MLLVACRAASSAATSSSVEISRRPDEVFAYVTDPSHFAEWQEAVVSANALGPEPPHQGSKVSLTRKVGRREQTMTAELTDFTPPRSYAFRVLDGPVRAFGKGRLEPLDDGSRTRFTFELDFEGHGLGKLLRYVGENNVLWGTDSIWYGSPQDQIQAFRTFQIAPELRDRHGYPEMTPKLRAKIFGTNALKIYPLEPDVVRKHVKQDKVARAREDYRERPDPSFVTYGPKTLAQLRGLLSWGN